MGNEMVTFTSTARSFAKVVRERRRQLDLTQEEVAQRIRTSTPYIGHLESGKRHPSEKVVSKMADVLGLDHRELFLLANPSTQALLSAEPSGNSAWDQFRKDKGLLRTHNVSSKEIEVLARVALMGEVRSPRDFIYILNTIRQALGH